MLEHALRSLQIKLRNLRTKQYPYSKGRLPKNISILLLIHFALFTKFDSWLRSDRPACVYLRWNNMYIWWWIYCTQCIFKDFILKSIHHRQKVTRTIKQIMNKNTLSEDGVRYMYNTGSNITLTNNKKMWLLIYCSSTLLSGQAH